MSIRRSFNEGPSAEARQDQAFVRKCVKDREREAFEKAEANRRDGRLPEDFSWERKRREPFVSSAEATESNQGGGDGERSETQAGATQAVEGLEDAREHRQG